MITIKEFAEQKKVTYEAVRRQIQRCNDDLKGHIVTQNGTRYLDDFAVEFLSDRRRHYPVVVQIEDQSETIEQQAAEIQDLKQQLEALRGQLEAQQAAFIELREKHIASEYKNIELQKKTLMIEVVEEQKAAAEQALQDAQTEIMRANLEREKDQQRIEFIEREKEQLTQARDDLLSEIESYRPSLFGFYRKVK